MTDEVYHFKINQYWFNFENMKQFNATNLTIYNIKWDGKDIVWEYTYSKDSYTCYDDYYQKQVNKAYQDYCFHKTMFIEEEI